MTPRRPHAPTPLAHSNEKPTPWPFSSLAYPSAPSTARLTFPLKQEVAVYDDHGCAVFAAGEFSD